MTPRRILRVFPRRTNATPADDLVRINCPPGLWEEADEVHVSVTFTWDLPRAEELARQWAPVAPVQVGGPALGAPAGAFVPGRYLAPGHTITSRGCPNRCQHCDVWRRQPNQVELPIHPGWILHDDNLLACTVAHQQAVFAMLAAQPQRVRLVGGLEASRLEPWHAHTLRKQVKPHVVYFAYDRPSALEPLADAAITLRNAGFTIPGDHRFRCYVLIAYHQDTPQSAARRLHQAFTLGFIPQAMVYRPTAAPSDWHPDPIWTRLARRWARPHYAAQGGTTTVPPDARQEELPFHFSRVAT